MFVKAFCIAVKLYVTMKDERKSQPSEVVMPASMSDFESMSTEGLAYRMI